MGRGGDPAMTDYVMSEKFGLDWKQYDYERMLLLRTIHIEAERYQENQRKQQDMKSKTKR